MKYQLRKSTKDDFMLSFEIRKNALGKYVEKTWGWNEDWQLNYHKEDFNTEILQIIEVDGKPAGTLESYKEEKAVRVSGLYIIDEYQNSGIGGEIMRNIISEAAKCSFPVKLQVLIVNIRARKFYERLGFRVYEENTTHFKMIYE